MTRKINLSELIKLTLNDISIKGNKEYSEVEIRAVVESFTGIIKKNVKSGIKVSITDFGIFWKSAIKSRIGVNPQTKEKIKIKGKNIARFTASKNFKMTRYGK